jgi:glycosyltransferase involved in cell wall biosynthesis
MTGAASSPFFSVVIPSYNRAALIERTLQSVLAQTWRDFEVIVVDDCSTDNTLDVLQPYVERGQIRLLQHERNLERAQARNTGMDAARGLYITFLDSDDLMYPTNLADAAAYIDAHPGIRCFHNLYDRVSADGRTRRRCWVPSLHDQWRAISEGNFITSFAAFLHRDAYTKYRFDLDPALIGSEDWEFWIRVLAEYRLGRLNKVNNGNVQHPDRSVFKVDLDALRVRKLRVVAKVRSDPWLSTVYARYLRYMEGGVYVFLAIAANSADRHGEALRLLERAVRTHPLYLVRPRFWRALQIAVFRLRRA